MSHPANDHIDRNDRNDRDDRRANPLGAYVAAAGALILLVSVWLDWLALGPGDSEQNPSSGYEGDSVIPLLAYLAVGFAAALLYALKRADRRQHRGLSLASFAVGLAALLWAISFIIDPISTVQYDENVSVKWGAYIGVLGALLWTVGSFLLAKEPEGDFEDDHRYVARTATSHTTGSPTTHTTGTDLHGSSGTAGGYGTSGGFRSDDVTDINGRTDRPGSPT